MKFVFGPVPSRRLGQSLGIDPVPSKTCNWNCVYCQLGRTVPLSNRRMEYFPKEQIFNEIEAALARFHRGDIDWITFVGSGETTLYNQLGWLIEKTREITEIPVAVITNGSLLYLPEVRQELLHAHAVLPTFDAGSAELFKHINRPHPESTFERLLDGLVAFRQEFDGKLWVEVMLLKDMNDTQQSLTEIANCLQKVHPDRIHINLPVRPPAEKWVRIPSRDSIDLAKKILGKIAKVVQPAIGEFVLDDSLDLENAILNIITRHPMRQKDIEGILHKVASQNIKDILDKLLADGKAKVVVRNGIRYWCTGSSTFS